MRIGTDKIISIKPYGEEPTYDLEVDTDPHNFLANDFVVHNTGKTTLTKHLYDEWTNQGHFVVALAPTGKACQVLGSKGVPAVTIHSAIYNFRGEYEDEKARSN